MRSRPSYLTMLFTLCSLLCSEAIAGNIYLTGAQLYRAAGNGGLISPTDDYRHSTNGTDTGASKLYINQGTTIPPLPMIEPLSAAISLQLLTNSATFSFQTSALGADPGNYVGINLFLSDTDASYNPSNSNIGGDLTFFTQLSADLENPTGVFAVVPATVSNQPVLVQNYAFLSAASDVKPIANGLTSFDVGGALVEVSNFSAKYAFGQGIQGRFTLKIVATPEPASIGLVGVVCVGLARLASKRKREAR